MIPLSDVASNSVFPYTMEETYFLKMPTYLNPFASMLQSDSSDKLSTVSFHTKILESGTLSHGKGYC